MLETLKAILRWDFAPAPEILLDEDGDLSLDWVVDGDFSSISIHKNGNVSWAVNGHGCGIGLEPLEAALRKLFAT